MVVGGVAPVDDTIARKVNASDASAFAKICGCFPSQGALVTAFSERRAVLTTEFLTKFGASSGSSSRSSSSSSVSWLAFSRSRYAIHCTASSACL